METFFLLVLGCLGVFRVTAGKLEQISLSGSSAAELSRASIGMWAHGGVFVDIPPGLKPAETTRSPLCVCRTPDADHKRNMEGCTKLEIIVEASLTRDTLI